MQQQGCISPRSNLKEMANHPEKPFNDLPPLPPQAAIETIPILKKTIAASRALSVSN